MPASPARTGSAAPRARSSWFPVLAVTACLAGLAWPRVQRELERGLARRGAAGAPDLWIDPATARVTGAPAWADPRWLEHLDVVLARHDPFALEAMNAADAVARLAEALEELSFVERVERCELVAGRLALALAIRKPVACIPARGEFALVDEDGVVLEGRWPVPPRLGRAYLPVIGPVDDPLFDHARSGDWLVEPEHLDAIDVALSLAGHLDEDRRAALGRIVVDARGGRRASVEQPGVRLELEGERLALFGRPPASDAPGELDERSKWQSLARALELFERDPDAHDWELVDLRWDRPDLALRNAPAAEPAVATLGARTSRGPSATPRSASAETPERLPPPRRDDGRPRVR